MPWAITTFTVVGNTTTVEAANSDNSDTMRLVVTHALTAPSYAGTFHYEHPLTTAEISTLNSILVTRTRAQYQALGLTQPPLITSPVKIVIDHSNMDMNGETKIFNWNGTCEIGASIATSLMVAALNGSGEVELSANPGTFFIMPRTGSSTAFATVDMVSMHRSPVDRSLEVSFNGRQSGGGIVTGSITMPSARAPIGRDVLFGLPLNFPEGTIAVPIPVADAPSLNTFAGPIDASYQAGVDAVMAMAGQEKWLCLRHGLKLVGIGWLCAIGIALAAAGTAGTGGLGTPALSAAVVASFGAKGLEILDLILAHLGFQ